MTDIRQRANKIIIVQLGLPPKIVLLGQENIEDDLGADSLDTIELIMLIEDEFDIEIPDHAVDNVDTVEDLIDCVKEYIAEGDQS